MHESLIKQVILTVTCLAIIFLCLTMMHLGFKSPYLVVVGVFLSIIAWSLVMLMTDPVWLQSLFGALVGLIALILYKFNLVYLLFAIIVLVVTFWGALVASKEKTLRIKFAPEEILRRPARWFLMVMITLIAVDLYFSPTFKQRIENFQMPADWEAKVLQMSADEITQETTVDQFLSTMVETATGKEATRQQIDKARQQLGLDKGEIQGTSILLSNQKALDILVGDKVRQVLDRFGPSLPLVTVMILWGIAVGLFGVIVPILLIIIILIYYLLIKTHFASVHREQCIKEIIKV